MLGSSGDHEAVSVLERVGDNIIHHVSNSDISHPIIHLPTLYGINFSITKHVFMLWLVTILVGIAVIIPVRRFLASGRPVPTGWMNALESIVQFIPNKYFEMGLRVIFNIERQVSKYLQGQLLAASSVALMSFIGLSILNIMGANLTLVVFIAIIAGLANLIPLVGPFAGMLPAILVAVMNNIGSDIAINHQLFNTIPSPFYILDIVIMFLIVQQIDNNIVTPILVGESVGIHPLIVMISLLIGGTLIGPIGMLLAVPAAGILKVIGVEILFLKRNAHLL